MWVLRLAAVCVVAAAPSASAYRIFQQKVPNGGNVPGVAALGHERPDTGGPNNDFGLDFIASMFKWSTDMCMKDSDGDGQTNGQELGDPCCKFEHRKQETVRWTEGVSHPGDAESKADPKLWEGIVCGEEETEPKEETQATENEEAEEVEETEEEEAEERDEEVEETQLEAAQDGQLTAGAPMMRSSVMLSAAALMVMLMYFVAMRFGRRSTRNLPIFRQRRGPM